MQAQMTSPSNLEPTGPRPQPYSPDAKTVREQLDRLLAHPLFTNSKRYPVLLTYTVEQTLLGNAGHLKERTIGVEAFGRRADYDANADPVVRTTAAEVRKRLIQYYYDASHADQLVIELSPGSYIPIFREPHAAPFHSHKPDSNTGNLHIPEYVAPEFTASVVEMPSRVAEAQALRRSFKPSWWVFAASILLVGSAVFAFDHFHRSLKFTNADMFWAPITSLSNLTTYCLGEPAHNIPVSLGKQLYSFSQEQLEKHLYASGRFNLLDVVTLAHTVMPLAGHHSEFRVLPASDVNFTQLREGPLVLIGALDNPWTLRLTEQLRFGFIMKDGFSRIVDRKNSNQKSWAIQMDVPSQKLERDYAVVARFHDDLTGQPVFIFAGLSDQGTEAASEVVYNPDYLVSFLSKAPKNWDHMNMEAVIETQVVDGHPGPPSVVAVETW